MNTNDAAAELAPEQQRWLEDLLSRFEQVWKEDLLASWTSSLPAAGTPLRRLALLGLIQIDLAKQWGKGRPAALEAYMQQFPELGGPADVPFQLIEAEHRQRLQHKAAADLTLFLRRFPTRAAELQRLASAPAPAPVELPAVFGRYRVRKKIGQGGMGTVYLAHDTQLDRQVAIKVPRFEKGKEAVLRERFLREARTAATLAHPNICPVYDVGEIAGIPFVTMAFIDGRPLNEIIHATKVLPSKPIAAVVRKLARAMQTAHDVGVVHRDLKPANVMIGKKNEPIIMDFGLARRMDRDEGFLVEGVAIGTPEYMAPEQVSTDESGMGPACDIYALGIVLYELLTGRVPFRGSTREVLRQVRKQLPEPPRQIRSEIEPALERICLKALAKDPAERFASMKEFAAALTSFLHEPTDEFVSELYLGEDRPPSSSALLWESLKTSFKRRRKWILGGAGGLFVLILLLVLFSGGKDPSVTIQLRGVPFLNETGAEFYLDGKLYGRDELRGKLKLKLGEHELVIKRKGNTAARRRFTLTAASEGKEVPLPDPEEEESAGELLRYVARGEAARGVWFLPDGRPMSSHFDERGGKVILWDPDKAGSGVELELPRVGETALVLIGASFSADGRRGLLGCVTLEASSRQNAVLLLWDLEANEFAQHAKLDASAQGFSRVSLSADGKWGLANPGSAIVWNVEKWAEEFRRAGEPLTFGGGASEFLLARNGGLLRADAGRPMWESSSVTVSPSPWERIGIVGSPDGRRVYFCDGEAPKSYLFDAQTGQMERPLHAIPQARNAAAFTPDGRRLLVGGSDNVLHLWDCGTGDEIAELKGHTSTISAVAVSPGGRRALSCGADKTIRLWRLPP